MVDVVVVVVDVVVVDMMLRLLRADMGALVVDTATCVAAEICTIVYHLGGHNNNPLLNSI